MSVNRVLLCGNLGRDPESRTTQGGTVVCNLNLAVNERRKRGDTWEDHTEWVRVVVFGKRAENCAKYLTKGSKIFVEGKLQTNTWEKDGEKRYSTEVLADDVQFLDGKRDGGGQREQPRDDYESQRKTGWRGSQGYDDHGERPAGHLPDTGHDQRREGLDDDIPF